jgi:hypothetical protein
LEYLKTKFDADLAAADYDARTPLHIAVIKFYFLINNRSCLLQGILEAFRPEEPGGFGIYQEFRCHPIQPQN